jgi:bifunctional UDP-N-acetylglucosamine pyrophosphorylase/glucosamine-1-phosphate N-acetyltransferase
MSAETPDCQPLSLTRRIEDFPIGNVALSEHQRRVLTGSKLTAHPHAWLDPEDVKSLIGSGSSTLIAEDQTPLAWHGSAPDSANTFTARNSFLIRHPWDLLRANEQYVSGLAENMIVGTVHPAAVIEGLIDLGPGSRILPGVFIEGNVVIGANCRIGPNCYLRGNTSIGDGCHIGQSVEIKNCLILSKTNVGHLSYVGDSILGENVNFGAGTTVSNLRHDGNNHRSMVGGGLIDTGRRKFGAIIGDGVHTGINTSIYPGRKLWPGTSTLPGEIVSKDLMTNIQ